MARQPALSFIFITLVIDILGIGIVIPILPKLLEELQGEGIETAAYTYGFVAAVFSLMQFFFAPLLGSLSDRFGRRPVILISLLGAGLDYFVMAWAPTVAWFVAARVVAGITAANLSAATAYIADISPPEKRAGNFGLVGAAFGIGFAAGPVLGGLLGEISLRLPFVAAGALALINLLYGYFVLPESLPAHNRRAFSLAKANPVGSLLDLKRYPTIFGLTGAYFLATLAHQALPSTWALYTAYRYNWSPFQIGTSLTVVGLMAALVQGGLSRSLIPRLGERRTCILALTMSGLALIGYGVAAAGWIVYFIIVFGSIGGLWQPSVRGLISRTVSDREQGGAQGLLSSLTGITGILGPILSTSLFGYFISQQAPIHLPGAPFFAGTLLTALAIFLAFRSFRKDL